mgnify:CR=1 FL=1
MRAKGFDGTYVATLTKVSEHVQVECETGLARGSRLGKRAQQHAVMRPKHVTTQCFFVLVLDEPRTLHTTSHSHDITQPRQHVARSIRMSGGWREDQHRVANTTAPLCYLGVRPVQGQALVYSDIIQVLPPVHGKQRTHTHMRCKQHRSFQYR